MSYIIRNNQLIAETKETLRSGTQVEYSSTWTIERISANRGYSLVSAKTAKISNAKKWENQECGYATQIHENEFLV